MTFLVGLPFLIFCTILQSVTLTHWRVGGGMLELTLLVVLSWAIVGEGQGGVLWGFIGGLCLDLLSGGPFGAATLGLTTMAYVASLTEGRFWRSHVLLPLITVMLGTFGFHLIYLVALASFGSPMNLLTAFTRITLPTLLINTLFMLPVYNVIRWFHTLVFPPAVKSR